MPDERPHALRGASYDHDVFLSCASDDLEHARKLTALLKRAGVRVWFYEEENEPGVDVQESLRKGIDASRHAVLLVSEPWIKKKYTFWELRVLSDLGDPERRMVPIARQSMKARELPAELSHKNVLVFDWTVDSGEALVWLVLCGIGAADPPGPRAEWAERGRRALDRSAEPAPAGGAGATAARPTPTLSVHPVLRLGRKGQWDQVCGEIGTPHGQLWLVWGDRRQAQLMFLRRIKLLLPPTRRTIVTVRWGPRLPASRPEFEEALAHSIGVSRPDLIDALKARVADSDLVLVHEPLFEMSRPLDPLLYYYTDWLPDLLDQVDPNPSPTDRIGDLRVVQALGWARPRGLAPVAGTLRSLGLSASWIALQTENATAREFVKRLSENASRRLRPVVLNELKDLTQEDIRKWTHELADAGEREALLQSLTRPGLDTAEVFELAASALTGRGRIDDA